MLSGYAASVNFIGLGCRLFYPYEVQATAVGSEGRYSPAVLDQLDANALPGG